MKDHLKHERVIYCELRSGGRFECEIRNDITHPSLHKFEVTVTKPRSFKKLKETIEALAECADLEIEIDPHHTAPKEGLIAFMLFSKHQKRSK